jgi:hypothetical protein
MPWEYLSAGFSEMLFRASAIRDGYGRLNSKETIHRDQLVENGEIIVFGEDKPRRTLKEYLKGVKMDSTEQSAFTMK